MVLGTGPLAAKSLPKYSQLRGWEKAQVTIQFTALKHESDAYESLEFDVQPL